MIVNVNISLGQQDKSISLGVKRSHAAIEEPDNQLENAPRKFYACTDNVIGPAILFDPEKFKDHITDPEDLQAFANVDDAEDFIVKKNGDRKILRRRAENLEITKRNESLQNEIVKLWI